MLKRNAGNFVSWSSVFIVFTAIYSQEPRIIVLAIIIAAFMDMFDGKLARKYGDNTKYSQTFGELTDSLCDLFNFGVAPSLILSSIVFSGSYSYLLLVTSFLFTLGGIYRLARFSATKDRPKVEYYQGVPITIAGPLLAAFTLFAPSTSSVVVVALLLGYLMISNLKIKKI